MVKHLTDKRNICLEGKDVISQTFVDIHYILNYIALKLLQPLQNVVHFLHLLFCVLLFCATKELHRFRRLEFKLISICHFEHQSIINPVDVNMNRRISRQCFIFLRRNRCNLGYLTLKRNYQVIQTHHAMLGLLF